MLAVISVTSVCGTVFKLFEPPNPLPWPLQGGSVLQGLALLGIYGWLLLLAASVIGFLWRAGSGKKFGEGDVLLGPMFLAFIPPVGLRWFLSVFFGIPQATGYTIGWALWGSFIRAVYRPRFFDMG